MPEPDKKREPVVHEQTLAAIPLRLTATVEGTVERGLNDVRLAVLGILVGIGLTVGFGVPGPIWVGVVAGAGSFVAACFLIRYKRSRNRLMSFMHWLTGM
jgi:hypothetical protein